MFKRKYCKRCDGRIKNNHHFCPTCGSRINNSNEENWGMLGRTDSLEEEPFLAQGFFGKFGEKMLNNMLGTTIKMLEKEMQKEMKNAEKIPRTNFRLMINGKEIIFNDQDIQRVQQKRQEKIKKIPRAEFQEEQLKAFAILPKEEPKTILKRFGDRLIYEIDMPEIKFLKDVLINKLENSIEIKAVGKTKAYSKIIPINMPIVNKELYGGKLVLELSEN